MNNLDHIQTLGDALRCLIENSQFVNSRSYPDESAALWGMAERVLREYDEAADAREAKRQRELEGYTQYTGFRP